MIKQAFLILKELGLKLVILNGGYRLAKATGAWRVLSRPKQPTNGIRLAKMSRTSPLVLLSREDIFNHTQGESAEILTTADEIVSGSFRAYGNSPHPIDLNPGDCDQHWSTISDDRTDGRDIKDTWEPARFGWVFPLIRAYQINQNDGYAQTFIGNLYFFLANNPPYQGSNWYSGQEAALRIIAILCGYQAFYDQAPNPEAMNAACAQSIFHHAQRIPATLLYARAQNNNHLLSEAAGLYSAGIFLQGCKKAKKWRQNGWRIFHQTLTDQIDKSGEYIQHSTNYHRLMLHLALWVYRIGEIAGDAFPERSLIALAVATGWLNARIDAKSGQGLNLGHHDGSHLLTLGNQDIRDYRPTIQAASRAFRGFATFPPGAWDELGDWLGLAKHTGMPPVSVATNAAPDQRLDEEDGWGVLRSVHYKSRPAHADQLHFDLWFQGTNVLLDAGTYRYTAPTPWRNALASSAAHNTIIIDHQDQMMRKGRFMWLDWAAAHTTASTEPDHISACHDGYRRLGCIHHREISHADERIWRVLDTIQPQGNSAQKHQYQLHWLLPMGAWQMEGDTMLLRLDGLDISLKILLMKTVEKDATISIIQGGKCLHGDDANTDILGWYSWTYGRKDPATSILFQWECPPPTQVETVLTFMNHELNKVP